MKSVVIVDDSSFMRKILNKIYTSIGYIVVGEADNGNEAIEMYKKYKPSLLSLDITMGHLNGIEALKEIMEYDINANVVMVSAMGQTSIVNESYDNGAKAFIVKPFTEDSVREVLMLNKLIAENEVKITVNA